MKVNGHLQKEKAITHIASYVEVVNRLKISFDAPLFKENFGKMSAIWQILLLHIIDPVHYPIFDQHVYRGFVLLKEGKLIEIPTQSNQKLALYKEYRKLLNEKFNTLTLYRLRRSGARGGRPGMEVIQNVIYFSSLIFPASGCAYWAYFLYGKGRILPLKFLSRPVRSLQPGWDSLSHF